MDASIKTLQLIRLASKTLTSTGPLYRDVEGLDKKGNAKNIRQCIINDF